MTVENPTVHPEISDRQWKQIRDVISTADETTRLMLENGIELRFLALPQSGFSAMISYKNIDIAHFMWEEVTGLLNVSHRIVNKDFRGQGIGNEMLYALEQRVQNLSNRHQCRYSLMIETSQASVIGLGQKRGMQLTQGVELWKKLQQSDEYTLSEGSHIVDRNGVPQMLRISKAFQPLDTEIVGKTEQTRTQILNVLKAKVA